MVDRPNIIPYLAKIRELDTFIDPVTGKEIKSWNRADSISELLADKGVQVNKGLDRGLFNLLGYLIGSWIEYFDERTSRAYTNTTKPLANLKPAGSTIYISDLDDGGCIVFSDGTNWRKIKDNSIVN